MHPDAFCTAVQPTFGPGVGGHGAGGVGEGPGAGPSHLHKFAGQLGGVKWQFALHQASLAAALLRDLQLSGAGGGGEGEGPKSEALHEHCPLHSELICEMASAWLLPCCISYVIRPRHV